MSNPHGHEIFVFAEHITPKENRLEDCLRISLETAKILDGQPGLLQSMVLRPRKTGGPITSFSVWMNKAAFQTFMKTDEVAALMRSESYANIKEWMQDYDGQMMDLVHGWHQQD